MSIFNVPQGFWDEHTFLYVTFAMSLVFNVFLVTCAIVNWAVARSEEKAKERKEMIEQIVRRVKREIEQEKREKK